MIPHFNSVLKNLFKNTILLSSSHCLRQWEARFIRWSR